MREYIYFITNRQQTESYLYVKNYNILSLILIDIFCVHVCYECCLCFSAWCLSTWPTGTSTSSSSSTVPRATSTSPRIAGRAGCSPSRRCPTLPFRLPQVRGRGSYIFKQTVQRICSSFVKKVCTSTKISCLTAVKANNVRINKTFCRSSQCSLVV